MSLHLTATGTIKTIFDTEHVNTPTRQYDKRALKIVVAQRRGRWARVTIYLFNADCLLADCLKIDDLIRADGIAFLSERGALSLDAEHISAKTGDTWRQILGARMPHRRTTRNRAGGRDKDTHVR